jgi:CRP-like cAMP-binding protein
MPANDNEAWVGLIQKLGRLTDLDAEDRKQINALPYTLQRVENGDYLVREGQLVTQCCLLVDGYACRHKTTEDGKRQIVSFHMRGDILDIQHLLLSTADHNVQAISPARVAWIPMEELRKLAWERPNIGKALWRDCLIDASIFREWVLNVGRRGAKARIAHMLCEFIARARVVGLVSDDRCALPLTQEEIGDATGLTNVHVNRMLRILRDEDVIAVGKRELQIMDWNRLREIAGFDSNYLHAAA